MFKKVLLLGLVIVLLIGVVGCKQEDKKVVVASKPHSEQYILAEMITQLIEAHTDIIVEKKLGIGGGTSNIHPSMLKGEIDIYPEYTGTGWLFVLKQDPENDPQRIYEKTKEMYLSEYNIEWLDLYGFNNTYALAIRASIAKELGIETYSDLGTKGKDLVFGAEYDFYEREDGFPGLSKLYGFDFREKKELDIGLKYAAIGAGEVDVINAFSTDGLLAEYDLKILTDDHYYFPSYHATTLVRGEILEKYPELKDVLNKLSGQVLNSEMIQMNYEVEKNNMDPVKVAKDFLEKKGLL